LRVISEKKFGGVSGKSKIELLTNMFNSMADASLAASLKDCVLVLFTRGSLPSLSFVKFAEQHSDFFCRVKEEVMNKLVSHCEVILEQNMILCNVSANVSQSLVSRLTVNDRETFCCPILVKRSMFDHITKKGGK
jgi:hypothetical protein